MYMTRLRSLGKSVYSVVTNTAAQPAALSTTCQILEPGTTNLSKTQLRLVRARCAYHAAAARHAHP